MRVSEDAIEVVKRSSFHFWTHPAGEVERAIEERKRLWVNDEGSLRRPSRASNVRSLRDYSNVAPDGLFEEGQDEW